MFIYTLTVVAILIVKDISAVEFKILNKDGGDIWIGIQGNPGHPHLNNGGFVLHVGQTVSVNAPDNWAGRFWSRTWCDVNTKHCETGDCGNKLECNGAGGTPPVTLVEITLKGHENLDFYDISLVDGFNSKASIEPLGGQGDGGQYSCKKAGCLANINGVCPGNLQVRNGAGVIACKSACLALNTDEFCCRGAFGTPDKCPPSTYSKMFKDQCPDAYSYAYDDKKSTFTCKAGAYSIVFGG